MTLCNDVKINIQNFDGSNYSITSGISQSNKGLLVRRSSGSQEINISSIYNLFSGMYMDRVGISSHSHNLYNFYKNTYLCIKDTHLNVYIFFNLDGSVGVDANKIGTSLLDLFIFIKNKKQLKFSITGASLSFLFDTDKFVSDYFVDNIYLNFVSVFQEDPKIFFTKNIGSDGYPQYKKNDEGVSLQLSSKYQGLQKFLKYLYIDDSLLLNTDLKVFWDLAGVTSDFIEIPNIPNSDIPTIKHYLKNFPFKVDFSKIQDGIYPLNIKVISGGEVYLGSTLVDVYTYTIPEVSIKVGETSFGSTTVSGSVLPFKNINIISNMDKISKIEIKAEISNKIVTKYTTITNKIVESIKNYSVLLGHLFVDNKQKLSVRDNILEIFSLNIYVGDILVNSIYYNVTFSPCKTSFNPIDASTKDVISYLKFAIIDDATACTTSKLDNPKVCYKYPNLISYVGGVMDLLPYTEYKIVVVADGYYSTVINFRTNYGEMVLEFELEKILNSFISVIKDVKNHLTDSSSGLKIIKDFILKSVSQTNTLMSSVNNKEYGLPVIKAIMDKIENGSLHSADDLKAALLSADNSDLIKTLLEKTNFFNTYFDSMVEELRQVKREQNQVKEEVRQTKMIGSNKINIS